MQCSRTVQARTQTAERSCEKAKKVSGTNTSKHGGFSGYPDIAPFSFRTQPLDIAIKAAGAYNGISSRVIGITTKVKSLAFGGARSHTENYGRPSHLRSSGSDLLVDCPTCTV